MKPYKADREETKTLGDLYTENFLMGGFDGGYTSNLQEDEVEAPEAEAPESDGVDAQVSDIAKKVLKIGSLVTQNSDDLDFHDVSVWAIKEALIKAYHLGAGSQVEESAPEQLEEKSFDETIELFKQKFPEFANEISQVRTAGELMQVIHNALQATESSPQG